MSDDPNKDLIARFDALRLELLAEMRVIRDEGRARDKATEELAGLRRSSADRRAKGRARERAELVVVSRDSAATSSLSRHSAGTSRHGAATKEVVVLDQKQRDQEQEQLPPASRHGAATPVGPTTPAWNAYSAAYEKRHGCEPADGKAERGKLMRFIEKVPRDEAPEIAAFYLKHNDALYIRAKHPIDLLLRDAQKLRTEWKTDSQVTGTEAREQERTQANVGGWDRLRRGKNGVV